MIALWKILCLVRPHLMESCWSSNCTNAILATNSFHLSSFSPTRDLLKEMLRGVEAKALATDICFSLVILYKDRYCSLRAKFPSHLSSQNLVWLPLWMLKTERSRKRSFAFIRPDQKCESPGFQWTSPMVLFFKYFFLRRSCQTPSSLTSLYNHLLSKQTFWISRLMIPRPPWSFGKQRISHFNNQYFFLWLSPCQKKADL